MASQQNGLSAMELERQQRIAANKLRMEEIGLLQTVQAIAGEQGARRRAAKATKAVSRAARKAAGAAPSSRVRRSERVAGIDAPNYNENARLLGLVEPTEGRDRRLMRENVSEEIYGIAHLDALGSSEAEWELFVDGYDAQGNRVYDKVNGLTCHQCRQKTLGKRTCCAGCESLTGVLCGDCLYMRYGENVDEVNANPDWRCPHCRDLCNCSFHRSKRGWAPTGTLYRRALAEGYTSVAHYLVLNSLEDDAKEVALERGMCPPELAADLKKELAASKKAAAEKGEAPAEEQGAAGVPAPAAAVEEQLLDLEGDQAEAAAPTRRGRPARGAAPAAATPVVQPPAAAPVAAAGGQRGRRQTTLTLQLEAGGVRKQKAGSGAAATAAKVVKAAGGKAAASSAAAGKAGEKVVAAAHQRRGLRSSSRARASA